MISTTPYEVYTVAEGATIDMLAEYYGVSAEEILNFNNITELIVGMEIKIPNTTVTEPFVLEEPPATEDIATPPNATPSDAEETVPNEDEAVVPGTEETTEPTEATGEEVTEPTTSTEPEQTEENTEPETVPIETEAPTEETSAEKTEEVIETVAASTDEVTEPTSLPETTASEETTSATETETTDAQ